MTYARKMAHDAQNRWLNGPGGHAHALESVEAVVLEVIERCAKEALTCAFPRCGDSECVAEQAAADRIRALAIDPVQP